GSADDNRSAARGAIAEDDPRMPVEAHPLVDVALRETHDRLAALGAALAERVKRLSVNSNGHGPPQAGGPPARPTLPFDHVQPIRSRSLRRCLPRSRD